MTANTANSCYVLSFNHHSFALPERERLSGCQDWLEQLATTEQAPIAAGIVLSTCNRLELYYSAGDDARAAILAGIAKISAIELEHLEQCSKSRKDLGALRHLMALGCGLDSMILGEGQILGQLKKAYREAHEQRRADKLLANYFEYALVSAGKIRQQTGIDKHPVSLAYAAVRLAQRLFGALDEARALIIGAGDNAHSIAQCLRAAAVGELTICNRSQQRGQELADMFAAQLMAFDQLQANLERFDIVVSSTASRSVIVAKQDVERALRKRKHKPMFMVDLSVPRDIEATVRALDDVYLYATDDLQHVLDDHLNARKQAAAAATAIIEQQIAAFANRQQQSDAAIKLYREQVELLRQQSVDEVLELLRAGGVDAESALRRLGQLLSNRLAHGPTVALQQLHDQRSPQLAELLASALLQNRLTTKHDDGS